MTRLSVKKIRKDRIMICLLFLLPIFLFQGCTVKEDREPCPCYLDIDYSKVLAEKPLGKHPGLVETALFIPEEECWTAFKLAECPTLNENVTPRGMARVVGVVHNRPLKEFLVPGPVFTWDRGNEIDSIYVHTSTVDCTGEEAYCLLEPHKQFHTIFFDDEFQGAALREYNLVVVGSTCGFDSSTDRFEAVEGPYLYTVQEYDRDGGISVRVPRQLYDDLRLEFWTKDDYRRVFVAPIGQYMKATGYDKEALDLVDFDIKINFRDALVYVRVADWDDELMFVLYD